MLLEPILRNAANNPHAVAITDDTGSYTNEKLLQIAFALGAVAKSKTSRKNVGILLPSSMGFVASFYGAMLAGLVPVPINFLLGPRETGHIIADSDIDTIITIPFLGSRLKDLPVTVIDLAELLQSPPTSVPSYTPPEYQADDLATILYTSGTSGLPKGVLLTHGNLRKDIISAIQHVGLNQSHRFLGIVPLFHSTGIVASMLAPMELGATTFHISRFSPVATIKAIREHKITVMAGVPSMYGALLRLKDASPADFDSMFAPLSGGEPLPSTIREAFVARFKKPLYEGYGLTETIGITCLNAPGQYKPGSVGRPIPIAKVKIVDDNEKPLAKNQTGEILIGGDHVMQGYNNLPDETARVMSSDGYFRTGDLGHIDDDGYVFITGRKKDLIIISGEKVYPREIEELLGQHPDIAEAAIIGRKDESRGEAVVAFLVAKEGHPLTEASVRDFCRDKGMVNWKIPKDIYIEKELPHSPTGKVLKRELAQRIKG